MKTYSRIFKYMVVAILVSVTFCVTGNNKYALLIGINSYASDQKLATEKGSEWVNLRGALNDVELMQSILVSRFQFEEKNISVLTEKQATRDGIFKGFNDLINKADKGDIVFVYYSGHGSQVKNSKSVEVNDYLDEAIVPYDALYGARYIRDKELAPLFNKILDKGSLLTVVFDCCNSGSLSRGNPSPDPGQIRKLPMSTVDVMDPTVVLKPAERGALILSASQDFEPSRELQGYEGKIHGVFTDAFNQAALTSSVYAESAYQFCSSISGYVQNRGQQQKPEIECSQERGNKTLLGEEPANLAGKTIVSVKYINASQKILDINGGDALRLIPGSRFRHLQHPEIEIEVTSVNGIATSSAKVVSGNFSDIKGGDLFELTTWGVPDKPFLTVYSPPATLSYDELVNAAKKVSDYSKTNRIKWILEPEKDPATATLMFTKDGWIFSDQSNHRVMLGQTITIDKFSKYLTPGKSSLFFDAPPFIGMMIHVALGKGSANPIVEFSTPGTANYKLSGRWNNGTIEYAWALPDVTESDDLKSSLPLCTNWKPANDTAPVLKMLGDSLTEYAKRLGIIMAWLNLPSPENSFPFHLALQNRSTNKLVTEGTVHGGETYYLVLTKEKKNISWDGSKRWVYVFSLDRDGKIQLNYPLEGSENYLPFVTYSGEETIRLGRGWLKISEPYGYDTYFLLVSDQKIDAPEIVFNSEAVHGGQRGSSNPLSHLFDNMTAGTRGGAMNLPTEWSVEKIVVKSVGR